MLRRPPVKTDKPVTYAHKPKSRNKEAASILPRHTSNQVPAPISPRRSPDVPLALKISSGAIIHMINKKTSEPASRKPLVIRRNAGVRSQRLGMLAQVWSFFDFLPDEVIKISVR